MRHTRTYLFEWGICKYIDRTFLDGKNKGLVGRVEARNVDRGERKTGLGRKEIQRREAFGGTSRN